MPKRVLPLTDAKVKTSKAGEKQYSLFDGGGLFLLVTPSGGKLWRLKYRFGGKEKLLALGSYPAVTLSDARQRRDDAKKLLANGIDPSEVKKEAKAQEEERRANTFEKLALEWHERQVGHLSERTRKMFLARFDKDIFPAIGNTPLSDLTPRTILENVLRPIEDRGSIELAHRVRGIISQVLRYGVACGACERDLTFDLRGALRPVQRNHLAAITDPAKVGALLRTIEAYEGSIIVKHALRLHPLVVTRPGELRHAEWAEIDMKNATWEIPAGKMKMKNPHVVPLSPQAISILNELHTLTGEGRYLFPSVRSVARPISDNTLNAALRRLGYGADEMTSHGWRAVFRTLADEVLQERIDIIEAQLAHQVADALGRAYNRTSFLKERRELMNRWASYLDRLKKGAKVISLEERRA